MVTKWKTQVSPLSKETVFRQFYHIYWLSTCYFKIKKGDGSTREALTEILATSDSLISLAISALHVL